MAERSTSTPGSRQSSPQRRKASRISKACEGCRNRKARCNGKQPCDLCALRRIECTYRQRTRIRPKKNQGPATRFGGSSAEDGSEEAKLAEGENGSAAQNSPLVQRVFAGVSATEEISPLRKVQLYYGPSSSFSLVRHIYYHLHLDRGEMVDHTCHAAAEESADDLEYYRYRNLFFGLRENPGRSPPSGIGHDTHDTSPLPPLATAQEFLRCFEETTIHFLPFVDPNRLRDGLGLMYGHGSDSPMTNTDAVMTLAALALGGAVTGDTSWSESLHGKVKAETAHLSDIVNLETIQIVWFYAHHLLASGRVNLSYVCLGNAVRKVLAAGLHKERRRETTCAKEQELIQTRRATFWSVYVWECLTCYILGRSKSIPEIDINIPYPDHAPFLTALARLCRIISRSALRLYSMHQTSLTNLWRTAVELKSELENFRQNLAESLQFGPAGSLPQGPFGIERMFLGVFFHHTVLLNFRPFVMFNTAWQRDPKNQSREARKDDDGSLIQPENPTPWISAACGYAVQAAKDLLGLIVRAHESAPIVQGLRFHGFVIGSACLLLIINVLGNRADAVPDLDWVRAGLRIMMQMRSCGWPEFLSVSSAIQRMLDSIELQRQNCSGDRLRPTSANASESEVRSVEEEPLYGNTDSIFSTLAGELDLSTDWTELDYFLNVDFNCYENNC